jgi:hypothetical protein
MSCTLISLYYENDSQLQFKGCDGNMQGKSRENIGKWEFGYWGIGILGKELMS